MSEIKLFRLGNAGVQALAGASTQVEKSLQTLFERNLEALLAVKFLATEHSTGPVHGGRIDTLGLDENNFPVIIEYKRAVSQNVINQGLFYLDRLLDHKKDFEWLVLDKLGPETAKQVDWAAPRLLCTAGDFTRHDSHAVKQIPGTSSCCDISALGTICWCSNLCTPQLKCGMVHQPALLIK